MPNRDLVEHLARPASGYERGTVAKAGGDARHHPREPFRLGQEVGGPRKGEGERRLEGGVAVAVDLKLLVEQGADRRPKATPIAAAPV